MMTSLTSYHHQWKHARVHFTKISLGMQHQTDAMLVGMQTGKGRPIRLRGSAVPSLTCKPGSFSIPAR